MRASSSEIACWRSLTRIVMGPPSGAFSTIVTSAPGRRADLAEVAEHLRKFLGHSEHTGHLARADLRERDAGPVGIAEVRGRDRMAVRADLGIAEDGDQALLDAAGDRVLEAAGLGVDLVPRHAEHLGEKALGQAMAPQDAHGDRQPVAREFRFASRPMFDEPVPRELLQHPRHRGRRDPECRRQRRGRYPRAFSFEAVDRLEILFRRLIEVRMSRHGS